MYFPIYNFINIIVIKVSDIKIKKLEVNFIVYSIVNKLLLKKCIWETNIFYFNKFNFLENPRFFKML